MGLLQSKEVDLVVGKDSIVDLYDEQIDTNKKISEDNKSDISGILGRLATLEAQVYSLDTNVSNIQNTTVHSQNIDNLVAKVNSLNVEVNRVKQDFQDYTETNDITQITRNKENIANLDGQVQDSMAKANQALLDISNLNSIAIELNSDIQQINDTVTKLKVGSETDVANVVSDLAELTITVGNMQENLTKVKGDLTTLNNKFNSDHETMTTAINSLKNLIDKVDDAVEELQTTTSTASLAKTQSDNAINKISNLSTTVTSLSKKLSDTNTTLNNAKKEVDALTTKVESNTKAIEEIKQITSSLPVAKVENFSIVAGGKAEKTYSSYDLYKKNIKLLVKDNDSSSTTYNMFIGAEGVATIAYKDEHNLIISNQANAKLDFKILIN